MLTTTVGLRPQYFSSGKYLRLSPRLNFTGRLNSRFSVSAGYTRNYQFVHRLYVENSAGSDIWVISNAGEPPGSVDHITASFLYRGRPFTVQVEGFLKWQDNLRRHETILRPGGIPDGAVLLSPWTHDNEARAKGLEALLSRSFGAVVLTATYALSRVEIRHPDVNNGAFFLADWDRPHQFAAHAEIALAPGLSASFAWNIASGQPNPLVYIYPSEDARYPTYRRLDASPELSSRLLRHNTYSLRPRLQSSRHTQHLVSYRRNGTARPRTEPPPRLRTHHRLRSQLPANSRRIGLVLSSNSKIKTSRLEGLDRRCRRSPENRPQNSFPDMANFILWRSVPKAPVDSFSSGRPNALPYPSIFRRPPLSQPAPTTPAHPYPRPRGPQQDLKDLSTQVLGWPLST